MKGPSHPSETPLKSSESEDLAQTYRFAGYELDCSRWQLRWDGEPLPLHRKSFDLLLSLIRAHGRVVSKDDLLTAVWPGQFVDENNLAQQVSLLRKALSRHTEPARLIETVPGRGYRLVPAVEVHPPHLSGFILEAEQSVTRITVQEETDEEDLPFPSHATLPASTAPALASHSASAALPSGAHRYVWAASAVIAVALLAVAGWYGFQRWQDRPSGPPVQAVLMPLEGTSGDLTLDHALNDALRFDLAESPFVSLVPKAQVGETLQEMQRPADEALSSATAREVCERTGSQAVVHTVLARTGEHFLLTGEAVSCVTGSTLASTEQSAVRTESLPSAIARLTGRLRHQLGEARGSVAHFATPAATYNTASLEALKAASKASELGNAGKFAEALEGDKRAAALDPNFAVAWFSLAIGQMNLNDMRNARTNAQRAYDLRNTVDPQSQRLITSFYDTMVTGDLYAAARNDELWTEEYPRNAYSWDELSDARARLGDYAGAAAAEQKATVLRPEIGMAWSALAEAQMHAGDLPASRAFAEHGLTVSSNLERVRMVLACIAVHRGDAALFRQQLAWLSAHPDSAVLETELAELAITRGHFAEAVRLTGEAELAYSRQGSESGAAEVRGQSALELIAAGDRADGESLLRSQPIDPEVPTDLMALALLGESHQAESLLSQQLTRDPANTLWHNLYAPTIHAMNQLAAGHPQDALTSLNAQGVLDTVDAQIDYLRGTAYLALHDPANAVAAFGRATAHPGFDSSYAYALSWLGLARAEAALQRTDGAVRAYRTYLTLTAGADPGIANVIAAKQELAALAIAH